MGTGKKKIEIKQIIKGTSRMVTFSKRRKGLFKKALEFESMTDSRVAIVVFSPSGKPYTYGDVNAAINEHFPPEIGSSGSTNLNVSSAIDARFPQFESSEIESSGSRNLNVSSAIDAHLPQSEFSEIESSGSRNLNVSPAIDAHLPQFEFSEIGSRSFSAKNGLYDWLKKIKAEECDNLNKLLLLKEQLEGTRDKLAEHSDSFEALFM